MKKFLSCMVALFAAVSLYAADLNIYASGLKATQANGVTTVEYVLNAPATAVTVYLYPATGDAIALPLTDATLLTKGAHQAQLNFAGVAAGTYTWGIKAEADTTHFEDVTDDSGKYDFYLPQDVAVDNNFESPFFGRVYVCESMRGLDDGHSVACQTQTRGIYIYNADLTLANGDTLSVNGYDGGLGGSVGTGTNSQISAVERHNLKRIAIDDAGFVYVASRDANIKGVYRMNPAAPADPFVTVLNASAPVDALGIYEGHLYTLEGVATASSKLNKYSLATLPIDTAIASMDQAPILKFGNSDCDAVPDGRGGWWFTEHRYGVDANPALVHMTAQGVNDFEVSTGNNASLLSNADGGLSYRGVVAVNPAGNLLAIGSNRRAVVFSVSYDETTGVPTLTKVCETGKIGGNIDGVAFDVANNLYVASASAERFKVYAIANDNNSFTTPAPAANTIEVVVYDKLYAIGNIAGGWNPTVGVEMTKKADNVFEGEFTTTADTTGFAFASALAENNDQGGWDYLNANRFSTSIDNEVVTDGSVVSLAKVGGKAINLTPAGKYKLTVDLNAMTLTVADANAPIACDAPIYIAFRDQLTRYKDDNGTRETTIAGIVKEGAEWVESIDILDPSNVYAARNGYGVKLGTSSKTGGFTIHLPGFVKPDSIVVRAAAYYTNSNGLEGATELLGDAVDLTQYGNKMITPITKVYDGQTAVSEMTFKTTSKRAYIVDVTIYPHGVAIPAPAADRTFGLGAALYLNVDTLEMTHLKYWLDNNADQKAYFVNANGDSTVVDGTVIDENKKVKFLAPAGDFRYVGFARFKPATDTIWNNTALFDLRGTTSNYIQMWNRCGDTGNGYDQIIWGENYEEPVALVYRIKHPWGEGSGDSLWIWKECEMQADSTWTLIAPYYAEGCNIDPKILDVDWIAQADLTLVGNPYWEDSCEFKINPKATTVKEILTITKLGEPNPVDSVYEHLYEIGDNQDWKPSQAIEMTKLEDENDFQGTFEFTKADNYFGFITLKPETDDWTITNANRFGPESKDMLVEAGKTYDIYKNDNAFKLSGAGKYTIKINLNMMKIHIEKDETGIENINGDVKIQKVYENGQIYIIRNGEKFTVAGAKVE